MKDTKKNHTFLSDDDQAFLDDFAGQWRDSLAQMRPLVDTSPEAIDDLCRQTVRHHRQNVVRRTAIPLSLAACVVALVTVGTVRWINRQPDFSEGPQYAQLAEEHISCLTPPAAPIDQPKQPAPQVHRTHTTPTTPPTPHHSQLSTLNVPARQRPCGANSQFPTAAPQDISAPLPVEEIHIDSQPIEHLRCNSQCDYTLLAMLIDSIALEEGGVA